MVSNVFNEFAFLLSLSVVIGFIAIKLRQPVIFSFIVVGIVAGPYFLNWISNQSELEVLANFGVTLLLFIVGLKLDIDLIKTFGLSILLMGLAQILLTTILGWTFCILLGYPPFAAFFIAFILSFSSTIIIIKILSDLYEIDSLYGRISIGILIIQDVVAILAIVILSSINIRMQSTSPLNWQITLLFVKALVLLLMATIARLSFPRILEHIARSRELLILFAVAWAFLFAGFANYLGFSTEVGGFLAGITLASSKYREAIASRLETVRNLLLLFFFLNLGAGLQINHLTTDIFYAILLSLFVVFFKPIIVFLLMESMGYAKRVSFITGLTLGQISEFSLIITALGISLGYVEKDLMGLITLVCLITIGLSTYFIAYGNLIYTFVCRWLPQFSIRKTKKEERLERQAKQADIVIYGFGRHGEYLGKLLADKGLKILAIDFDPEKIKLYPHKNILIKYGDAEDVEFPKTINLNHVKWIISTLPKSETNKILATSLKELKYTGQVALSAYHHSDIPVMKKLHADLIMIPFEDTANSAAEKILSAIHRGSVDRP